MMDRHLDGEVHAHSTKQPCNLLMNGIAGSEHDFNGAANEWEPTEFIELRKCGFTSLRRPCDRDIRRIKVGEGRSNRRFISFRRKPQRINACVVEQVGQRIEVVFAKLFLLSLQLLLRGVDLESERATCGKNVAHMNKTFILLHE